ncbi:hypothetical protein D4764_0145690 [Takifugu flavidus]|uniref:Uncharacterized protein n=1 Tax=Takifugu flavidus TaxID=433684 RepID=A0A5C6MG97_9TELE|nr:hypothetical protein D4764_0145690 [Takifugu flavidus]
MFTEAAGKPGCLLSGERVAVMKEYHLRRHHEAKHADKDKNMDMEQKLQKVEELKPGLKSGQALFRKAKSQSEAAVKASLILAEEIAQSARPFPEGDSIKHCMLKVEQLEKKGKDFMASSLAVEESSDIRGDSSLNVTEEFRRYVLCTAQPQDRICMKRSGLVAKIREKMQEENGDFMEATRTFFWALSTRGHSCSFWRKALKELLETGTICFSSMIPLVTTYFRPATLLKGLKALSISSFSDCRIIAAYRKISNVTRPVGQASLCCKAQKLQGFPQTEWIRSQVVRHVAVHDGRTFCHPGAPRVAEVTSSALQLSAQHPSASTLVLEAGINDLKFQQSEVLKQDFISLVDRLLDTGKRLIISGPLPLPRYGDVITSRPCG